jgi:glycosyltransferase A (GT-A) superfamily protein (DUF2064 family)
LIGLRELHKSLFQGIEWSQAHVLEQTLVRLNSLGLPHQLLPRRIDLDTAQDLRRLCSDPALIALEFQRTKTVLREL